MFYSLHFKFLPPQYFLTFLYYRRNFRMFFTSSYFYVFLYHLIFHYFFSFLLGSLNYTFSFSPFLVFIYLSFSSTLLIQCLFPQIFFSIHSPSFSFFRFFWGVENFLFSRIFFVLYSFFLIAYLVLYLLITPI